MSATRSPYPPHSIRPCRRRIGTSDASEPSAHVTDPARSIDGSALFMLLLLLGCQLHRSRVDGKTGLLTADTWWARVTHALPDTGHELALLIVDLDHFKTINDIHGHLAGDAVLAATAAAIRAEVRDSDLAGRYGGDEFVILLRRPHTPAALGRAALLAVAHRLLLRVRELRIPVDTPTGPRVLTGITASIGTAARQPGTDLATLFRAADSALYRAKASGRDTVRSHDPNPPDPDPAAPPATSGNPVADFIRSQPGGADRLLKLHRDDGTRHCTTCSNGAAYGRSVFPCAIYAAAIAQNNTDPT